MRGKKLYPGDEVLLMLGEEYIEITVE